VQWKALAEKVRDKKIEFYKEASEQDNKDLLRGPGDRAYCQQEFERWQERTRLDHIKVCFLEKDGTEKKVYIQLERSRFVPFLGLFYRYYSYDQKHVESVLNELSAKLPLEKNPRVSIRKSHKQRLEKRSFFSYAEFNDLYSITINYVDSDF